MWHNSKIYKREYEEELLKQTEPYEYYSYKELKNKEIINEGEHENVPFICMEKIQKVSEDESATTYEYEDYILIESKKGFSSDEDRKKLLTNAIKLNADLIYSDYDHVDKNGKKHTPFYKPDYSSDTFESFDYYSEFYAVKKNKSHVVLKELKNVAHVTEVLFHWNCEEDAAEINRVHKINNDSYRTDDFYSNDSDTDQLKDEISIIIPSKDNPALVEMCLKGIKSAKIKSGINTIEVVLIDNGSTDINKTAITSVITKYSDFFLIMDNKEPEDIDTDKINIHEKSGLSITYIYDPREFNFSYMCNKAAEYSTGKYLLFMNDDIEVTDELFLKKLLYFAKEERVGAVGCKLLYPGDDRRIQHTGITALKYAGPSHKLSTFPDDRILYFGKNRKVHNYLAVTGACLMVSREKYFKIGGFHDKMKVGYNDVDLCVSLYEGGYENLVNNDCVLLHHESVSRGHDAASARKLARLDEERNMLYSRHPWLLEKGDPYYNPNLAEDFLDYRVNVIPDFERRDYVSLNEAELVKKSSRILDSHLSELKAERARGQNSTECKALSTSKGMFSNIESVSCLRGMTEIKGWALINKKENYNYETYLTVVNSDGRHYIFSTAKIHREDLKSVFPEALSTELSGFMARVPSEVIANESALGILVLNKKTGKKYYAGYNKSDI